MKDAISSSAYIPLFLPTTVPHGDGSASHARIGAKNDR